MKHCYSDEIGLSQDYNGTIHRTQRLSWMISMTFTVTRLKAYRRFWNEVFELNGDVHLMVTHLPQTLCLHAVPLWCIELFIFCIDNYIFNINTQIILYILEKVEMNKFRSSIPINILQWKISKSVLDSCACPHSYYSLSKCFRQKREREMERKKDKLTLELSFRHFSPQMSAYYQVAKKPDWNLIIEYIIRAMNGIAA